MDYAELAETLRGEPADYDATVFPDGSVDTYYEVYGGSRIDSRTAFGERVADGTDTFSTERTATEPGGQGVNVARQVHALGGETHLFGHLDDPIFDGLEFEATSMGAPASVVVYEFEDGDLMLAEGSDDMTDWTLADLRAAAGEEFSARLTADVVCCVNWVSFDSMTDALDRLASGGLEGGTFVFDPGDPAGAPTESLARLCGVLGDLERSYDVVVSADDDEIARLAEVVAPEGLDASTIGDLRAEIGITAVVRHGKSTATAATPEGRFEVPTSEADGENRQTGAGDRFSAGLAHGLAADYGWENALGLGNLCASHRVEYGETGTREALAEYADRV